MEPGGYRKGERIPREQRPLCSAGDIEMEQKGRKKDAGWARRVMNREETGKR